MKLLKKLNRINFYRHIKKKTKSMNNNQPAVDPLTVSDIASDITTKLRSILGEIIEQIDYNKIDHDQNSEEYIKFNLYRNKIATIVDNMNKLPDGKLRT
jgi:hypothetical protein